jgi:hypothetical protein
MSKTVFFSWQSDRPTREGRNLIERALEAAVSRISEDAAVEEAAREGLVVDKDTKGVPGSPPLFDTILKKIEGATVFVPDLTFVGARPNGEPTPNPNVLIEYGWALRHLGHQRIVAVMNEAYGGPKSLPFDLAHHRFPITYNVPDDASETVRQSERLKLAKALESGIKAVFDSPEFKASVSKQPEAPLFKPKEPMNGRARFRPHKERIGVYVDPASAIVGTREPTSVYLSETAAMWLRVIPVIDPRRKWLPQDLKEQALRIANVPLIPSAGDIHFVRDSDGCGYFRLYDEKMPAPAVSYIFDTSEIWVINAWPSAMTPYIHLDEKGFTESLTRCTGFLETLGVPGPYKWIAGIEGFKDRFLYIPNRERIGVPCLTNLIEVEGSYQKGEDASEVLRPFFERVFDQCGVQRVPLRP